MWLFTPASAAARAALIYITVGALIVIWTGVWYVYLHNNPPDTTTAYYWCGGLLVTGMSLLAIGLGLGRIGRAAKHADHPAQIVPPVVMTRGPGASTTSALPGDRSAQFIAGDSETIISR
jgi:hypothetical protein